MSITEPQLSRGKHLRLAELRVAVVMGGTSGEREVSLVSGRSVVEALERCVMSNALASVCAIEIDPRGLWVVDGAAHDAAKALVLCRDVHVFFLALHGGCGEDGSVQGLLESSGRRHTGSGVGASAVCMDKAATRGLAAAGGLCVAPGVLIDSAGFAQDQAREIQRVRALPSSAQGWVVKPRRGGSSVNTHLVTDAALLEHAIGLVLQSGDDALVESRIRGIEVSCGVLAARHSVARALPPIEIQHDKERFFDYEQKYSESGAKEICPSTSLDEAMKKRVEAAALALHRLCGCAGYSRSDFIVPPCGDPVLLEINTLPGLTPRSLLPQEAAVVGITYDELCLALIECACDESPA